MITGSDARHPLSGADECIACHSRFCQFQDPARRQSRTDLISLNRGDRLEASAQACLKIWTIIQGTAAICRTFEDGRRQIISLETIGETTCGLMAAPESDTWLEALDDCVICEQDFSSYAGALRENPNFILSIFRVTHKQLDIASRHLATLGRLDSTERVILFLAEMVVRTKGRCVSDSTVTLPMSREDIADYLGLNTETVSRIMSRLKKSGLVRFFSPTEYAVPDFAAIERRLPVAVLRRTNSMAGLAQVGRNSIRETAG